MHDCGDMLVPHFYIHIPSPVCDTKTYDGPRPTDETPSKSIRDWFNHRLSDPIYSTVVI